MRINCCGNGNREGLLTEGGRTRDRNVQIWRYKVPPTVKVFAFLMLQNRILTHDVMIRRNMRCDRQCVLCGNCPVESSFHIFFLCPYVVHVWFILSRKAGFNLIVLGTDLEDTWIQSLHSMKKRGGLWRRNGASLLLCTIWMLWKTRNGKIFADEQVTPQILADRIWQETPLWVRHC